MRVVALVAVAMASVVPAGCGDEDEPDPRTRAESSLSLSFSVTDPGGPIGRARLRCDGRASTATGYLAERGASALCARARSAAVRRVLAGPPSPRRACTQIYGGPQVARITGRRGETRIARTITREDGCRIAEWDALGPLLPAVRGVRP